MSSGIDSQLSGEELECFVRDGGRLPHLLAFFGLSLAELIRAGFSSKLELGENLIARLVSSGRIVSTSGRPLTAVEVRTIMQRLITEVYSPESTRTGDSTFSDQRMPGGVPFSVERAYRDFLVEAGHSLLSSKEMDDLVALLASHAHARGLTSMHLHRLLLLLEPFFELDQKKMEELYGIYRQLKGLGSEVQGERNKLCKRALMILEGTLFVGDEDQFI